MLVLSCLTYKINNNLEIYPCFINMLREIIEHFLLYFKKDFFLVTVGNYVSCLFSERFPAT